MKQNTLAQTMVRTAVEKAVRDIKENPGKGARSLVDLGSLFASSDFQKEFLAVAGRELKRPDSAYTRLVQRVIVDTDGETLTTFGVNFGYNCRSQSVKSIRKREEQEGHHIPWCLQLELDKDSLRPTGAAKVIRQGKELGIRAFLLFVHRQYPELPALLEGLGREADCAFVVFLHPDAVDRTVTRALLAGKNICAAVDLAAQPSSLQAAYSMLQQSKCLHGSFFRYSDFDIQLPMAMEAADLLGTGLLLMVDARRRAPGALAGKEVVLQRLRLSLPRPVLPLSLYTDMATADQAIPWASCRVTILEDGNVAALPPGGQELRAGNIRQSTLKEILAKSLPLGAK